MLQLLWCLFCCGIMVNANNCSNPYYFQPLSTLESSIPISPEQLSEESIDCRGETEANGIWIEIVNNYDYQLSFQITASEDIVMDYYSDCDSECVKTSDDLYLVLNAQHHQLVFVSFSTPYNTIFFTPINNGDIDNPIVVNTYFPKTISTTLSNQTTDIQSVILLRCALKWKINVNITSNVDIETEIKNTKIGYSEVFKDNYFEFDNSYDNVEYLVTFKSTTTTVIEITFNQSFYLPEQVIDTVTLYPYIRYEVVPSVTLPDTNNIRGFFCGVDNNIGIVFMNDISYTFDNWAVGNGKIITFNTEAKETYKLRIGFLSDSWDDRSFVITTTTQEKTKSDNGHTIAWIVVVSVGVLFFIGCVLFVVAAWFVIKRRFKQKELLVDF
ncbi:Transmembrane protein [Entamoeba marina]